MKNKKFLLVAIMVGIVGIVIGGVVIAMHLIHFL
jgi:hypothetical protein